ncbi:MAG: cellulase family glycosylhydrolase [Bryobacterales bacterium]
MSARIRSFGRALVADPDAPGDYDPHTSFADEAHLYFDQDASGRYFQSFSQELASNPGLLQIGRSRLQPFRDWCVANGVRCFVGEYGIPGQDPGWLDVLENLLTAMDEAGMGGTYWAAGDWWGDYPLSVQPDG